MSPPVDELELSSPLWLGLQLGIVYRQPNSGIKSKFL